MLPRIFFVLLLASLCLLCAASTGQPKTVPKGKEPVKRSTSLDDSFFGNIYDHEEIQQQIAKDFFKDDNEDSTTGSPSVEKTPTDSVPNNSHSTPVPKSSVPESKDEVKTAPTRPPLIPPIESNKKFSCSKRALYLYKLTIRTITNRLQTLSSLLTIEQDSKYFLQLQFSSTEIYQLEQHLNELESILDIDPTKTTTYDDSLSEPTNRFCRNLDSIEVTIRDLISRMTMHDPTRRQVERVTFWSSLTMNIPDNFHQLALWLVWIAVLGLVLFLFPWHASRQRMVIFTIIVLVLGLSLMQFFWKEQREYRLARAKKFNIQLDNIIDCGFYKKFYSFVSRNGYQCTVLEGHLNIPQLMPEAEDDFYEQFIVSQFLIKFAVWMCILGPFKEIALEMNDVLETIIDGSKSDNWYSPGAWFRSILWSNFTKPIWALFIIWLVFNLSSFMSYFRWILSMLQRSIDPEPELNYELVRPRVIQDSRQPESIGAVQQVVNHYYISHNNIQDPNQFVFLPPAALNLGKIHLNIRRNEPDHDEYEYLSAEEGED